MENVRELVAYYSFDGNTRIAAELYAKKRDARLYEIELERVPKGKVGFFLAAFGALTKAKAKIKPVPMELFEGIEEITVATPVWAASATPAVNAFLAQAPIAERRINVITIQCDQSHKGAEKIFQQLSWVFSRYSASAGKHIALTGSAPGKKPDREAIAKQIG